MYLRDGFKMPEMEEGAAFFRPIAGPGEEVWGVQRALLTRGFVGTGADPETIPEVELEARPFGSTPYYESSIWRLLSIAGVGLGAYHGYKRNNSVWWGIGWALLGGLVPIITIPISLAQGFAKPKGR